VENWPKAVCFLRELYICSYNNIFMLAHIFLIPPPHLPLGLGILFTEDEMKAQRQEVTPLVQGHLKVFSNINASVGSL
jgi:hypothetical protein